jgi:uncharacterized membrane protein YbhN (UPF0104 family)
VNGKEDSSPERPDDGVAAPRRRGIGHWAKRLAPLLSLVIFAAALALLHHVLHRIHLAEVVRQLARTPSRAVLSGLCFTVASYLALAGFDGLGAYYIGRRLSPWRVVFISFVSHAVSHSAGFATLTGGAIRYRLYSAAGLSAGEVAAVVAFCGLTFGLGACSLAALALLSEPHLLSTVLRFPPNLLRGLGVVLALGVAAYVGWGVTAKRPLKLFGRSYPVPRPRIAGLQIAVAASDLALASATLFVLLPEGAGSSYPAFVGAYVVANLLGLLAHVPGGLGVFDAAILVLTPGIAPEATLGALLLFRGIYNLLPLALAAATLLLYELLERVPRWGEQVRGAFDELGPPLLAVLVFAGGAFTVFAHAIPRAEQGALPSHLMGFAETAIGTFLMVLARGLNRRNRLARLAGLVGLIVLAVLVLIGDPFAPRALVLVLLAAILALSGGLSGPHHEYLPPRQSPPWILAISAMLGGACWLTFWLARTQPPPPGGLQSALVADAVALLTFMALLVLGFRRRGS